MRELLLEAEQQASELLEAHRDQLKALIEALEEKETLDREDIERCLDPEKQAESGAKRQTG